jgi:sugar/nucleoside kinase (ribokinase family)
VEAAQLTGTDDLQKAARALHELGPREIVLTHRDGVLVFDGRGFTPRPFTRGAWWAAAAGGHLHRSLRHRRRLEEQPARAAVWAAAVTSLKMESDGPFRRDRAAVEELIREKYA